MYYYLFFIFIKLCVCDVKDISYQLFSDYINLSNSGIKDYDFFNNINESRVSFLFTTKHINYTYIDLDNLESLPILKGRPFKVLIHAHEGSPHKPYAFVDMVQAYRQTGRFNIILPDWSYLAESVDRTEAAQNCLGVGRAIGSFIVKLNSTLGVPLEDFHLLGPSISSHVAGYAGKQVHNLTGLHVGRITAMDPAGLIFDKAPPHLRLDKSDAIFVDVIHTDNQVLGTKLPLGHADFYPNNGVPPMPGCKYIFSLCNHVAAIFYLTESITSEEFVGSKCDDLGYEGYLQDFCVGSPTAVMGEHCNTTASGHYFLTVNAEPPFARGKL